MIVSFKVLKRHSKRKTKAAVLAWLCREKVPFLRSADGEPFTTLDAINRRLQRSTDEGFTLEDPEGGLRQEREVLPGSEEPVDRLEPRQRWARRVAQAAPGSVLGYDPAEYDPRAVVRVPPKRRDRASHKAGI